MIKMEQFKFDVKSRIARGAVVAERGAAWLSNEVYRRGDVYKKKWSKDAERLSACRVFITAAGARTATCILVLDCTGGRA